MVNDGEGGAGLKLHIWVILGRVFKKGKVWTIKDGIEGGQKTNYIFAIQKMLSKQQKQR